MVPPGISTAFPRVLTDARPFRRRVLLNTASTGLANVWAIVVTLVTLPIMLHGLGSAAFGSWVLIQTLSAVTGWLSIADLGMRIAATRAVAERAAVDDHEGVARVVGSAAAVYAAVGTVCSFALLVLGPRLLPTLFSTPAFLRDDVRFAIQVFAAQVLLELLAAGLGASLEGMQRVDLARACDAARRTLVAATTGVVALNDGGLRGVATASLGATVVGAVLTLVVLRRHLPPGRRRPSLAEVRSLVSYGTTVGLLNATGVLHRTMDRVIVGAVMGPAPVALVEIATQVQNGASSVLGATSYATLSSAPWLRARGADSTLQELFERGTRLSLLATLPVVGLAAVLAAPIVDLWVGSSFAAAAGLSTIAVLYVGLAAPLQVGSLLLQGVGRAGVVLRAAALAVAVNLAASLLLVHWFGVVGVFQGTLIGTAVLLVPLARASLRETGVPARRFFVDAVLPGVLPTIGLCAAAAAVLALPLGDVETVALGTAAGVAVFIPICMRWSLRTGELRELLGGLRRGSST